MILNTGSRTDIPAFYSEWFYNRVHAGFVLARNPYYPSRVTRYRISPDVVDAIVFCSKNPEPMFDQLSLLEPFTTFWFVSITPYGPEVEPRVPNKDRVADSFCRLSELVGPERMSWRYDPVFISRTYTIDAHIEEFGHLARRLRGSTTQCVVSFIDLYEKTRRNFPEVSAVTPREQEELVAAFADIAQQNGMHIHLCCENPQLTRPGVDATGCLSSHVLEQAIGAPLRVPAHKPARPECNCLLGADIGAYNTCNHGCRYCYANYDQSSVRRNMARHDPTSPLLIGNLEAGDVIKDAQQTSWIDPQSTIFEL